MNNPIFGWNRVIIITALVMLFACGAPPATPTPVPPPAPTNPSAPTPRPPTSAPVSLATTVPSPLPTGAPSSSTPMVSDSTRRPNIVFILADDLDAVEYAYMPKLKSLIADQGVTIENVFVNVSLCCPSRATILRGQYAHNSKIYGNMPPDGGHDVFVSTGGDKSTIAVWLQEAGYKTMLAGKYLNGYPSSANPLYIPPGWSEWYSAVKGNAYGEYNYTLNENGKQVAYGKRTEDYGTDVYTRKATDFIARMSKAASPFFIYLSFYAPHSPYTAASRHEKLFADAKAPRTPNYNEEDVSDKPAHVRAEAPLTAAEQSTMDENYRKRLQSLQAVDEGIESVVNALKSAGQLENTYVVFASDNGYHLGNHRLGEGKMTPYEEDIRVPMIVRGPSVPIGKRIDRYLAGNLDYAVTFADLAGTKAPDFVDGRSLAPLWSASPPSEEQWRQMVLIMYGNPNASARPQPRSSATQKSEADEPDDPQRERQAGQAPEKSAMPSFAGLRTRDYTYVEYANGEKELYDMKNDPYQLQNLAAKADANLLKQLSASLAAMKKCAAASCRSAENPGIK